jgi:hypothetical protein
LWYLLELDIAFHLCDFSRCRGMYVDIGGRGSWIA